MQQAEMIQAFRYCQTMLQVQEVYKRLVTEWYEYPDVVDRLYNLSSEYEQGKRKLFIPTSEDKIGLAVPNYKEFRQKQKLGSYTEFWNSDATYGENLCNLIDTFVKLPNREIQLPIVAAYNCMNLPLISKAPILYLYGGEGSGKSVLAKVCGCINGSYQQSKIFQASSTFASIRNYIEENRHFKFYDPDSHAPLEKSLTLTWDDVTPELLIDQRILNLMKAYDRATANIQIGGSGDNQGSNQNFFVFALKVLTSVTPIFQEYRFRELSRRCFFVKCSRHELSSQLKQDEQLLQVEDYDWRGLENELYKAWNEDRVDAYADELRHLKKPEGVNYAQWEISRSLIASGLVMNIWTVPKQALENLVEYWAYFERNKLQSMSATQQKLNAIIEHWVSSESTQELGLQEVIDAGYIQKKLKEAALLGELNQSITAKVRTELMLSLGWRMERRGSAIVYVPNL